MRFRAITELQGSLPERVADAAANLETGGDPRGELRELIAELEAHPDADLLGGEIALLEDLYGQIDGALRAQYGYRASPDWLAAVSDRLDARNQESAATGDNLARSDENLLETYRRLDPDPLAPPPPRGASTSDAGEGAAGTRSDLYEEPVPFEGRSLEGSPGSDVPNELARSLEAEIPIENLLPIEPVRGESDRISMVMSHPTIDVKYEDDALIERQVAYAENTGIRSNRTRDSVWDGAEGHTDAQARKAATDGWAAFVSAQRTSPMSFSDGLRPILSLVAFETTRRSDEGATIADLCRGVDPANSGDGFHAAHYVPEPRGWKPGRETGFGQVSLGWNEFPFSCREHILNALLNGESLSPARVAALEWDVASCRTPGSDFSSSQCRAMTNMLSDAGHQYQHARWHMPGSRDKRLLQLIEMLDHAVVVV